MQSSVWFATLDQNERRILEQSDPQPSHTDVAIIGGGIIGLAIAYYLTEAGVSNICVIERDTLAGEATGANAGGLWFGQQSQEMGPLSPLAKVSSNLYDQLAAQPGREFDYRRRGLLELFYDTAGPAVADETVRAVCRSGSRAERIGSDEIRRLEPALAAGPAGAVFYPDEGELHPVKLAAAFARSLRERKVSFLLRNEVSGFGEGVIHTAAGELRAKTTVIAAGAWTPLVSRALGFTPPIKPMRGQLLATPPRNPLLHHTIIGPKFYHWQLAAGHVAGGGTMEDVGFERGVNPRDIDAIRHEMNTLFPELRPAPTVFSWSGFRPCCEDLRPVIGRIPGAKDVYVAAGHFKKGIMLAPVTGKILADLIASGKTDLPIEPFNPARFAGIAA